MNNNAFKHGFRSKSGSHPVYNAWIGMKDRCYNTNVHNYQAYGGRGIKICERWMKFENFRDDMFPTWQKGLSLDRIDVNGNYEPSNCKWATKSEQAKNRRCKAALQSSIDFVSYDRTKNKWQFLVRFNSKEEAETFALQAKTIL